MINQTGPYLVIPRVLIETMSDGWYEEFNACLSELYKETAGIPRPQSYAVIAAKVEELWELSDREIPQVLEGEVSFNDDPEDEDSGGVYSIDGEEVPWDYKVHIPVDDVTFNAVGSTDEEDS